MRAVKDLSYIFIKKGYNKNLVQRILSLNYS